MANCKKTNGLSGLVVTTDTSHSFQLRLKAVSSRSDSQDIVYFSSLLTSSDTDDVWWNVPLFTDRDSQCLRTTTWREPFFIFLRFVVKIITVDAAFPVLPTSVAHSLSVTDGKHAGSSSDRLHRRDFRTDRVRTKRINAHDVIFRTPSDSCVRSRAGNYKHGPGTEFRTARRGGSQSLRAQQVVIVCRPTSVDLSCSLADRNVSPRKPDGPSPGRGTYVCVSHEFEQKPLRKIETLTYYGSDVSAVVV